MAPRISTPDDVRRVLEMVRFPPKGSRGNALARGYLDFRGHSDVGAVMREANAETMLVVQVETSAVLSHLETIAAMDGVDALLVGPNDLSIALGVGGQQSHPTVEKAIEQTIAACNKYGRCSAHAAHCSAVLQRSGHRVTDVCPSLPALRRQSSGHSHEQFGFGREMGGEGHAYGVVQL
jgi:2-keto-3-deoxy-L-rhamnonate aldolase RhmA